MDKFTYNREGELQCEDILVKNIVDRLGTPLYLYSVNTLKDHYTRFAAAFSALSPLICFSIKTLNNLYLIRELVALGSGIDTVSGGEIFMAKAAGADMSKVVYAGIGKTDAELEYAIDLGVGLINIESEEEFINAARIAASRNRQVRAALRITPDVVDDKTHSKTKTGYRGSKFGVDLDRAKQFFHTYGRDKHVRLVGLHVHIGSPIYSPEPYRQAICKLLELTNYLEAKKYPIETLDIGGGYSADYTHNLSPRWESFAEEIVPLLLPLARKGVKIIMEPGRTLSANAGILLTTVNYIKCGGDKQFAVVDTGMHHLIRPTLYDADHYIWPVSTGLLQIPPKREINGNIPGGSVYDVVGPICESGDFLARARQLPVLQRGDVLAIFTAGAYGMVMSSQYNAMPRPAEACVDRQRLVLIRERESYPDLLQGVVEKDIPL